MSTVLRGRPARWAVAGALADLLLRSAGALPGGLGPAGAGTRWVDWISVVLPYAVVGSAVVAVAIAGTDRRGWWLALLGAGAYLQGHGVHLAAASIGNARGRAAPVPLWADVVGPALWWTGLALLAVAVARALALRPAPASLGLAGLAGLAWTASTLTVGSRAGSWAVVAGIAFVGLPRLRQPEAGASAVPAQRTPAGPAPSPGTGRSAVTGLLAASVVAMVLTHWLRLLPLGFAAGGQTRYEDFVDLLTPYVVAGPALVALARVRAGAWAWGLALAGTAAFTQGQGLHLSANSISYAFGAAPVDYLWDEQVGHHLWFVGLAGLVAVVVHATRRAPLPVGPTSLLLAALVGLTWAANVVEGGVVPVGSALAAAFCTAGWRTRTRPSGQLLVVAFGIALVLTAAYGVWLDGFPQPSELGWL